MKISNETKVGALTAIAITILVLGFTFLKGKSLMGKKRSLYAVFENVQGLTNSNAVMINGKQVGSVAGNEWTVDNRHILITISMKDDIEIPANSVAFINSIPLTTPYLEIKLGDSARKLVSGDTLDTRVSAGILSDALKSIDPVLFEVKNAVKALDSVIVTLNGVLDPNAKNNIRTMLANLTTTSASLTVSSASLEKILNTQTGALAKTLDNVSAFTGNLAQNNQKITNVLSNLDSTTAKFSRVDLQKTVNMMNSAITDLKGVIAKANTKDGTLGMLLNDPKLYNNLASTANKMNLLIDDIRVHPKRYVSISVFGKKDKTSPLETPTMDTANAPYYRVIPLKP